MKRLLLLGAGSALMFTMGGVGTAQADNGPHISTAMGTNSTANIADQGATRCASCHRAHTAKAALLLKAAQPALCYSCHGGGLGAKTDVQNGTSGSSGAALRGGGFDYALIGAGAAVKKTGDMGNYGPTHSTVVPVGASEATTSSHQINGTTSGTMWGNGAISASWNPGKASVVLECSSCHDPHGNGNYRILKPIPSDANNILVPAVKEVKDADGNITTVGVPAVMSITTGINIPDAPSGLATDTPAERQTIRDATHIYTTDNYWDVRDTKVATQNVGTAAKPDMTDGYIANASQWCSTCHTRYLAKSPDYETNSTDAIFTYRHTSGRVDKGGVERPNCIQCHVSHGSNAAMSGAALNVPFPGAAASIKGDADVPSADSRLLRIDQRGVCVACHNV